MSEKAFKARDTLARIERLLKQVPNPSSLTVEARNIVERALERLEALDMAAKADNNDVVPDGMVIVVDRTGHATVVPLEC